MGLLNVPSPLAAVVEVPSEWCNVNVTVNVAVALLTHSRAKPWAVTVSPATGVGGLVVMTAWARADVIAKSANATAHNTVTRLIALRPLVPLDAPLIANLRVPEHTSVRRLSERQPWPQRETTRMRAAQCRFPVCLSSRLA